jgi:hypothetical protein
MFIARNKISPLINVIETDDKPLPERANQGDSRENRRVNMIHVVNHMLKMKEKVVHWRHQLIPANGIPYILGQGLHTPYIEPKLTVHWHPPFTVMPAEEPVKEKRRVWSWLSKLGIKRK